MNKLNTTEAMKLRPRKITQLIQANASDNYGKKIKNKVQKSTSTERMRKLRESRREDKDFDMDSHLMKECERIAELRRVQKVARERDPKLLREYRMKQRLSKMKQRARNTYKLKNTENLDKMKQKVILRGQI